MWWNPCLQELVGVVEPLLTGTCGCGGTFAYRSLWVRWNPCLQDLVGEVEPLLTGACGEVEPLLTGACG